eukprot:Nk52_evm7s221 gene=Nk52_evmTU7s221
MHNYNYMTGSLLFPLGGFVASFIMLAIAMATGNVPKETRMMSAFLYSPCSLEKTYPLPELMERYTTSLSGLSSSILELGEMFGNGFKCFFGMGGTPDGPDQCNNACNNVWEWFTLYIVFNFFVLADFLFLSEDLAGTVQPLEVWTVFGMIAVAIGVIMYGSTSELDKDGNEIMQMESKKSIKETIEAMNYDAGLVDAEKGVQRKLYKVSQEKKKNKQ